MYQTAWTKKTTSSSLPSDRLRPKAAPSQSRAKGAKNTQPPAEPTPQSKALRLLNALSGSLQDPSSSTTPDPTGGCFCQARSHPLSQYVPICTTCALPLCNLAAPAHLCPSCSQPLLTPAQRAALITRIDQEIADTTLKEQLARERAEQDRRDAAGAFPTLSGAGSSTSYPSLSPSPTPTPQQQQHKVLSLNSKTKRAVLTTTTTKPKVSVAAAAPSRPVSPQPTREPRPTGVGDKPDIGKAKARGNPTRPWQNFGLNGGCTYVPPLRVGDDDGEAAEELKGATSRRRKRGKAKAKEGTEGRENFSGTVEASGSRAKLEVSAIS
ncbi:hypothetical protein H0H81_005253 [Sphagnurus paluster]|uniref:TRIP4/RQT4 C2HC5-type zinc finger domain-containing protein n=1 Tax=Sphagnurus paluster TaxID=117069 RepID=A0A9P7FSC7_9AGAR|nr:hypothetical protein H0H81_005253 [Sphagnurus paluster]